MGVLGGSSGDDAKRSSRDLREALDDATGATAFVGAILGIVGGAGGPLLAPGFALAAATAVVLAKWLKRVERDPPSQDYESYVPLRSNRVDPFRLPGVVQPELAALIVGMDSTSAHLEAMVTAIERAEGARQHGDRLHASAREAEASAFARLASRPLHGLGAAARLHRVEATQWELSLSEQDVSAVRDRIDDPISLARALHEAERRWPRGPEYEDDPDLLGSVQAAGAQREALAMPLRLVPRSASPYPWGLVPHHTTALAAALKRWAGESRREADESRREERRSGSSQRQQKIGEGE